MSQNNSHFLDKQTLIALAIIFISWFLWERYMQTKYKPVPRETTTVEKEEKASQLKLEKPNFSDLKKETFFNFEDKEKKVIFSSQGMGVKEIKLKNFLNRDKTQVQFKSLPSTPLFELTQEGNPLFFKLETIGKNQIKGVDESGRVQVVIDINKYSFSYKVDVNKKISSVEVQVANKPVEGAEGLLQSLIAGGEPGLSLFAKTSKEEKRILYSKDQLEKLDLSQLEILGLGRRYFGQAFFNQSDILPRLNFQGNDEMWHSQIIFQFPKTGDNRVSLRYQVFFGPKSTDLLKEVHPKMITWIDFGFLSGLAKIILAFLKFSFLITKNWGLSIILLTLFVRVLLFPLNFSVYRSMKIMKKIQPEIQALRQKYKGDMKTMNEKMLTLMKKNKARPLGGCLPMLLQCPIFFALYRVLWESFELYQAPFFWWINDLSLKDPFYVVPVLMGASMYLQQKITPTNMDPAQEKVLRILPFIFTLFMINLPSGLNLYILVSTLFGLVQQYYFTKKD